MVKVLDKEAKKIEIGRENTYQRKERVRKISEGVFLKHRRSSSPPPPPQIIKKYLGLQFPANLKVRPNNNTRWILHQEADSDISGL